jgi:mersacidin/lichenicidin family type 2 lantibiotic
MSAIDIVRAWKDPDYRARLTAQERESLPAHPAGLMELDEADLDHVAGGGICRYGSTNAR